MGTNKIKTFKELIRLFWDNKKCKIIPVLDDSHYVVGYYQKKNVTAHIADNTFLSQEINNSDPKILSVASRENEGAFLKELGETKTFPVIYPDGSYSSVNFTDFLADHIPLMYSNENKEDAADEKQSEIESEDFIERDDEKENNLEEIHLTEKSPLYKKKKVKTLSEKKDLFDLNQEKIKPFFEEFDFNGTFDLVAYLEGIEKRIIEKYLNYYENNVSRTAEALNIPRQTLQYKIKKYNL